MNVKKFCAVLTVVMFAFAFIGIQALAAGQEKEKGMERSQTTGEREGGWSKMTTSSRASEIIGLNVKDRTGEQVGEVEDIVIGRDGRVQYLIISHGGLLGIGENMVPIPYRMTNMEVGEDAIVLKNVDKQMLENAPNFSDKDWESTGDPTFEQKINTYYGQGKPGYRSGETQETYQKRMDREKMDQEKRMREQQKQR